MDRFTDRAREEQIHLKARREVDFILGFLVFLSFNPNIQSSIKVVRQVLRDRCEVEASLFKTVVDPVMEKILATLENESC